MKLAIGIPTYNDYERVSNLVTSIFTFTPKSIDFKVVILDDGTSNDLYAEGNPLVEELKKMTDLWKIPLIINKKNEGIPYSWNRLTEYYDAEYVILLNDDIQISSTDWLDAFLYFMEENNPGSVGFPIVHVNPYTSLPDTQYNMPNENSLPGRVGSPVGCCFGFKKENWKKIKQPDGSIGFYESLISFYEEIDFGFELSKLGIDNYMLPYPLLEHWGSQTFAKNPELSVRTISPSLSKDEYLSILKQSPTTLSIPFEKHVEIANISNQAFRMDYSRVLFAKKWECDDFWNVPQVSCQKRYVDVLPKRLIKWIAPNGRKREQEL